MRLCDGNSCLAVLFGPVATSRDCVADVYVPHETFLYYDGVNLTRTPPSNAVLSTTAVSACTAFLSTCLCDSGLSGITRVAFAPSIVVLLTYIPSVRVIFCAHDVRFASFSSRVFAGVCDLSRSVGALDMLSVLSAFFSNGGLDLKPSCSN